MKDVKPAIPDKNDLIASIESLGIESGDVIYLSTQLYGIGMLKNITGREDYLRSIHDAFTTVLGPTGTLVVPTFTQQVGMYGVDFHLEKTQSLTGIFGEYIRLQTDNVRSLHPVFSVCATGHQKNEICEDVSPVAFGKDSVFDRLVSINSKAVCMGFDYYSGHIVSLMHLIETAFGVPYYYNKIVDANVYANGTLVDKTFVINVRYLDFDIKFNFRKFIDHLSDIGAIHSALFGRGTMHAVAAKTMFDEGIFLLKSDIYAFLDNPPAFKPGQIPFEGPGQRLDPSKEKNWTGMSLSP